MKTTKIIFTLGAFVFLAMTGMAQEKKATTKKTRVATEKKAETSPAVAPESKGKNLKVQPAPASATPKKNNPPINKENSRMVITEEGVPSRKSEVKQQPKMSNGKK